MISGLVHAGTLRPTPGSVRRTPDRCGSFSLVELVVVIVIISIIAAIAVPRLTTAASGAQEAALAASLRTMRDAIDRYAAEHIGTFPGVAGDGTGNGPNTAGAFVSQLTKYSNVAGGVSSSRGTAYAFGPYLRRVPPLPVSSMGGADAVAIDAVNSPPLVTAGDFGWVYNPTTGEIIANSDEPNAAGLRTFDEY